MKTKEFFFEELGYMTTTQCKNIKKVMDGKTYMNFEVIYSNFAGNCTLGCRTNYDASESEIKNFFLASLIANMAMNIK